MAKRAIDAHHCGGFPLLICFKRFFNAYGKAVPESITLTKKSPPFGEGFLLNELFIRDRSYR